MNSDTSLPALPVAPPKTNGLAVASFVMGLLSVLICGVGIIFSIPGAICGIMGLRRIRASTRQQKGRGLAVAGLVMSAASLVLLPIVGLLAAIAIPNFVKARETAQRQACFANLRMLQQVKETWAVANNKPADTVIEEAELIGDEKAVKVRPRCPKDGTYVLNDVGTRPECSLHGPPP
jgi:competence protein ComGC